MTRALAAVRNRDIGADDVDSLLWLAGNRAAGVLAVEAWDYETSARLSRATSQCRTRVGSAGTAAVCVELSGQQRLCSRATYKPRAALVEEERLLSIMTGHSGPRLHHRPVWRHSAAMPLARYR